MKRQALVFADVGRVAVVDEDCPAPGPGELVVRTRVSAVSAGTELLAYRGQLPADLPLDATLPELAAAPARFPFRYGYAAAGVVAKLGPGVAPSWRGRRVFAFVPHASAFVAKLGDVIPVPDGIPDELAPLYANSETAVNLALDGRPLIGERVAVLGQGVVGLLLTAALAPFPLERLLAIEPHPTRAALARRLGAHEIFADAASARAALGPGGADLVYELTGNPAALDGAIALAGDEARVVVGSFYGDKRAPVALGGHFHRGRLRLISSQVSHIAPELGTRWDRARRGAAAWRLLAGTSALSALVSHRMRLCEATRAYQMLADVASAGSATAPLQLLFVYD